MLWGDKVFIVAEAGINHEGNKDIAIELVKQAKLSNADAIKFQIYKTENFLTHPKKLSHSLEKEKLYIWERVYEIFKRAELKKEDWREIFKFARAEGIIAFATPLDLESAEFLEKDINVPLYKVASSDIDFLRLHEYLAGTGKPVIISTGMAGTKRISRVLSIYPKKELVALLHCVSIYPTPLRSLNLLRIKALRDRFGTSVGFSDHTRSLLPPVVAVSAGAKIIEKHFTIGENIGVDASISLTPETFGAMVEMIRDTEKMLGNGDINSYKRNMLALRGLYLDDNGEIIERRPLVKGGISAEYLSFVLKRKIRYKVVGDILMRGE